MNLTISNRLLFVLSLVGIGLAGYLTLLDLTSQTDACSSGCDVVHASHYAWGFGIPALKAIPTAAFGLLMYVTMAALSFVRIAATEGTLVRKVRTAQWLLATVGVLAAAWLVYLMAYQIKAWCKWCLASDLTTLLLFVVTTSEQIRGKRAGILTGTESIGTREAGGVL